MALRFAGLHFEQRADFDVLLDARDVDAFVFLDRAAVDADEAELLHERIDARAPDLGDQRAGWIGFDVDFLLLIVGGFAFESDRAKARKRPVDRAILSGRFPFWRPRKRWGSANRGRCFRRAGD